MKTAIGLVLIFAAVWGVLDATGVVAPFDSIVGDLSVWQIIVGVVLLGFVISRLTKCKIPTTMFGLSLLFMLFEGNIAVLCGFPDTDIINNWLLLGLTILLCIGLTLVLPKGGRWRKEIKQLNKLGVKMSKHSAGANTVYIDAASFTVRAVENNMGATMVRFENAELYGGEGELIIENNMGSVQVMVPDSWSVETEIENNLGNIQCASFDSGGPILRVVGENNLGAIEIVSV